MSFLEAVILGIVQGFTEFLPISSSGHLIVARRLFGIEEPMLAFDIIMHLGSLVAVFAVFWKNIFELIKKPFQNMTYMLIVATIPAVIVGLLFKDQIEVLFEAGIFLALCFIITGLVLLYSDSIRNNEKGDKDMRLPDALFIGCVQAIAIAPGISRSGSTIAAGLHRGFSRETAARFSFLLSIPAILGAAVLMIIEMFGSSDSALWVLPDTGPLVLAFLAAMLSGYLAIRFMLNLIKKCKLRYFSIYLFVLSGFILVDIFLTQQFF